MIHVETSTTIDRPLEDVFAYVDALSRMSEWIDILAESTASESPTRVGTRVDNRVHLLGRNFQNTLEVVEREPNHRMVLRTERPFAVEATFLVEPADGGTAFSVVLEAQPSASAFFKLGEPILTGVGRRRFKGHLRRLKKRLESGGPGAQRAA
ncbi:MAG TPA: SRPBCC family protein [Candidatus Dormibacteraeota bacterium]